MLRLSFKISQQLNAIMKLQGGLHIVLHTYLAAFTNICQSTNRLTAQTSEYLPVSYSPTLSDGPTLMTIFVSSVTF